MTLVFFDTDVLLSAYDAREPIRQQAARHAMAAAIDSGSFVTSVFVLYEFHRLAVGGLLLGHDEATHTLRQLAKQRVVSCDADSVLRATALQRRHALKLGDALIVQAALDAGCRVLYSDSLPHGLVFETPRGPWLTVFDPLSAVHTLTLHEPAAAYRVTDQAHAHAAALA